MGLLAAGFNLDLGLRQFLVELKVLTLKYLMLSVGFSLFQLNLLNKHDFFIKLDLGLLQLLGHEFNLLSHRLAADICGSLSMCVGALAILMVEYRGVFGFFDLLGGFWERCWW